MRQPFTFQADILEFVFPEGPGSAPADGDAVADAAMTGLPVPPVVGETPPIDLAAPPPDPGTGDAPPSDPGPGDVPPEPGGVPGGTPGGGPVGVRPESGDLSSAKGGNKPDSGDGGGGGTKGGGKPGGNDGGSTGPDTYTSGDPVTDDGQEYNITLAFENAGWTDTLKQALIDAADYLSTIITGDLSDERVPFLSKTYGRIDDLLVQCQIVDLDDAGTGDVLAGAAVSSSRVGSDLPASALLQIDIDDVAWLSDPANAELLDNVMLHELIHAMGFGGKWADMGLVSGDRFTGALATWEYNNGAEFQFVASTDDGSASGVLIEQDGGAGTAGGHWDEALYGAELMTGYIDAGATLSKMSIAALEDMGYDTIYDESVLAIG